MTDSELSAILKKIESIDDYRPGGYHPIHIGDQLSKRVTVVDKLGWGEYSTAWLASDHDNEDACVVVSVSKASAQDVYCSELMPKMRRLQSGENGHVGKQNLLFPLDSFSLSGPNGKHFCLVMNFEGQTVSRATNRGQGPGTRPFPLSQAKQAVLDLGNAILHMHTKRMNHNGLHPANFYLGIPIDRPWTAEQFQRVCGKPKIIETARFSDEAVSEHKPTYLVQDALTYNIDRTLFEGPFKIADFGHACDWNSCIPALPGGGPYIVLELAAHRGIGGAADIWMFGCAIYQFLSGFDLMGTINDPVVKMVHQFMDVLGEPPPFILGSWKSLCGEGSIRPRKEPRWPLALRVQEIRTGNKEIGMKSRSEEFTREHVLVLTGLLSTMLQYDPESRPSIHQVLNHPAMDYFRS